MIMSSDTRIIWRSSRASRALNILYRAMKAMRFSEAFNGLWRSSTRSVTNRASASTPATFHNLWGQGRSGAGAAPRRMARARPTSSATNAVVPRPS